MDWQTIVIAVLGSGIITAIVNGLMNYRTKINSIKESGLYTRRAKVLDELMKRLERLDRLTGKLVSPFQFDGSSEAEKERRKDASDAFNYFVGFYKRNRHYLSKKLSDDIGKLCIEYKELFTDFSYEARPENDSPNIEKWRNLFEKHSSEFSEKKDLIAEEFRKIIGVR